MPLPLRPPAAAKAQPPARLAKQADCAPPPATAAHSKRAPQKPGRSAKQVGAHTVVALPARATQWPALHAPSSLQAAPVAPGLGGG